MEISVHGVTLHYELCGQTGPCILLLHGWGCSTRHFDPIIEALKNQYRLCVIDFPAHGQSSRPPEPWGVSEFCECLKTFLEEIHFSPCNVIAHSFGGRVALMLSAHYPEMVQKMILTGCAGLKSEKTPEQKKREASYKKKKALLQSFEKVPVIRNLTKSLLRKMQQKYGSADYNALDDEMKKTFVKVISEDLRPLLPHIKSSTLLVWGENDTATPLWMGKTMENEIPDAGLVIFENDDHFAYLRQWPRFTAIVKAFIV